MMPVKMRGLNIHLFGSPGNFFPGLSPKSVGATGPLDISNAEVIASGKERTCYIHPLDPHKCIKVKKTTASKQHERERRYFQRLSRRNLPWIHVPAFYGTVETNFGPGNVFSMVRDFDGSISRDLRCMAGQIDHDRIIAAAEELKQYFIKWHIITCDMNPGNFLIQRLSPETFRMVMIDGVGNREFIPVSTYCFWMCRWKMRRRWRKFDGKLARVLSAANRRQEA